jgi:cytochrome c oxidase cbb3-type subunit 1
LSALAQPALPPDELQERLTRVQIDRSARRTVVWYYTSAVGWLLAGSLLAIVASVKMHAPGFLTDWEWLTFGRVRPAHLLTVIYGWGSMAGVGTLLWLEARLCRVRLPFPRLLPVTAIVWNVAVVYGTVAVLAGYGTSVEWLEMPPATLGFFAFCVLALIAERIAVPTAATVKMFSARRVSHTYVSQWYLFGAVFWFPFLYTLAILMIFTPAVTGVAKAAANWWFAHNVLGLWFTPIGLATAYYLIPKVIGRPVHSYHLSLLGFWTLAIFYNWAGTHHLIGGPLPAWLVTVGIVGSVMMFIPVVTVAVNHPLTMAGHFDKLKSTRSTISRTTRSRTRIWASTPFSR